MSILTAGNVQQLTAALSMARAGDTVLLEPGTYSGVFLKGYTFDGLVTIASSGAPGSANLTDLKVQDSSGLKFEGLQFSLPPEKGDNPIQILGSQNIHLSNLDVHGTKNGSPSDDVAAILIRNSANVSVTGSEFSELQAGVGFLDSHHVTISGNEFHNIRMDGVRGGGTSDLIISRNTFTDFFPSAGDHADAIQIWSTNAKASARNIDIFDNLITRGTGEDVQGIFVSDASDMPFINLRIVGNVIIGGGFNGIGVFGATDFNISHNTVVGYTDVQSWIRVHTAKSGVIANNETQTYVYGGHTDVSYVANTTIGAIAPGAVSLLNEWLGGHLGDLKIPAALGLSFSGEAGARGQWIQGDNSDQVLSAQGAVGDAWIEAGGGNDLVLGTAFNDYLRGDAGADSMDGGGGADDMNGNTGSDTLRGGDGDDWVVGGKDDDLLYGEAGADIVYGNLGNDTCHGAQGADWVRGGQGDDLLFGGDGADFMAGDRGADTLSGGGGADKFYFFAGAGIDQVTDFSASEGDYVSLDAGTSYTLSQSAFGATLTLSTGDVLTLLGVQASALPAGWVVVG